MFLPFTDRNDVPVHILATSIIALQANRKWVTNDFGSGAWEIDDTLTLITYGSGESCCVKASVALVLTMLEEPTPPAD